jgi:hypothetical protein
MNLKRTVYEGVDWFLLSQDKMQLSAVVNTAMNRLSVTM